MDDMPHRTWRFPVATATVLVLSVAFTGASLVAPWLADLLRRDLPALKAGELWRVATPLVVQPDPWPATLSVWVALCVFGTAAEQIFGVAGWLALYATGAAVGEIAGYLWQPTGSGGSVAVVGLLGGLLAWFLSRPTPWFAKTGVVIMVAAAMADTWMKDIHGLPLLAGMAAGALLLRKRRAS
jgi:membrane associated rhomboid family serine protease